jgi:septation ring formation regulator EzrA
MPKKNYFETNLKNVNILRRNFDEINKFKGDNEPFYSILNRVLGSVSPEQVDNMEQIFMLQDTIQTWRKRALEAEEKLKNIQRTLV